MFNKTSEHIFFYSLKKWLNANNRKNHSGKTPNIKTSNSER